MRWPAGGWRRPGRPWTGSSAKRATFSIASATRTSRSRTRNPSACASSTHPAASRRSVNPFKPISHSADMHAWNEPILNRIQREGLPHALLIHGAQGVGKLALAERIAQLVLCEAPPEAKKPCGQCDGCRWFLGGNHPDFRRVEPEALMPAAEVEEGGDAPAPARRAKPSFDIKIDQVRELADFLHIGSHRGARRVALVHPAEAMNPSAANALLKGLEEPPAAAMFILVSHRPSRLLATVRSRCVSLPVPIPAREAALEWLRADGLKDPERWLAYAGGAPLRAIAFASQAETLDRLMRSVASGADILIDDR